MWWELKHLFIACILTSIPAKMIKIDYVCQSYGIPKLWTFYFKTRCIFSTASDCCNM